MMYGSFNLFFQKLNAEAFWEPWTVGSKRTDLEQKAGMAGEQKRQQMFGMIYARRGKRIKLEDIYEGKELQLGWGKTRMRPIKLGFGKYNGDKA